MGRSGPPPPGPANMGRSSRGRCYPDEAEAEADHCHTKFPSSSPVWVRQLLSRLVPSLGL